MHLKVGARGEIALPGDLRRRYHLAPDTPVRVVETRGGILLVPLTGEAPKSDFANELTDWQSLGAGAWDLFPYDGAE